jgi:hypothetical protein
MDLRRSSVTPNCDLPKYLPLPSGSFLAIGSRQARCSPSRFRCPRAHLGLNLKSRQTPGHVTRCSPPGLAQTTLQTIATGGRTARGASDLPGVWSGRHNADRFNPNDPPMQAWAVANFKTVQPGYGPHASALAGNPVSDCLPPGIPRIFPIPFPMQIMQLPGEVVVLFEYDHSLLPI